VLAVGLGTILIEGNDLGLIILVLHLVLHLLVLMDVGPGEENNKGKNSEEEHDELNELEYPVEADQGNVAVGGTTETNVEDDDVDEGIDQDNERH